MVLQLHNWKTTIGGGKIVDFKVFDGEGGRGENRVSGPSSKIYAPVRIVPYFCEIARAILQDASFISRHCTHN